MPPVWVCCKWRLKSAGLKIIDDAPQQYPEVIGYLLSPFITAYPQLSLHRIQLQAQDMKQYSVPYLEKHYNTCSFLNLHVNILIKTIKNIIAIDAVLLTVKCLY